MWGSMAQNDHHTVVAAEYRQAQAGRWQAQGKRPVPEWIAVTLVHAEVFPHLPLRLHESFSLKHRFGLFLPHKPLPLTPLPPPPPHFFLVCICLFFN